MSHAASPSSRPLPPRAGSATLWVAVTLLGTVALAAVLLGLPRGGARPADRPGPGAEPAPQPEVVRPSSEPQELALPARGAAAGVEAAVAALARGSVAAADEVAAGWRALSAVAADAALLERLSGEVVAAGLRLVRPPDFGAWAWLARVNEAPAVLSVRPLRYVHSRAGLVDVLVTRAGDGCRVSCRAEDERVRAVRGALWEISADEPATALRFVGGRIHVAFESGRVDVLDRETGRLLGRR
jgi:hypothetical protein